MTLARQQKPEVFWIVNMIGFFDPDQYIFKPYYERPLQQSMRQATLPSVVDNPDDMYTDLPPCRGPQRSARLSMYKGDVQGQKLKLMIEKQEQMKKRVAHELAKHNKIIAKQQQFESKF